MPVLAGATTYYISPSGSDGNAGVMEAAAFRSFAKAFSAMNAGDELILLDGIYSEVAGTGYISSTGANSGQIPSGVPGRPTYVRARTPGNAQVVGGLQIGTKYRKDSYILVQGITFEGVSSLYNTSYVTIKDCGFHDTSMDEAVMGIGTNDHEQGNSFNLIEDCWVWGKSRAIAINYRAQNNVWRRVVIRGDGCNKSGCVGDGNPNHGIVVYDSANTSLQNVIVVDRILGGGSPYGDFTTAQHTTGVPYGNNEWLGCISLNSEDTGFYLEPDEVSLTPAHRVRNAVVWDANGVGINLARQGVNDVRNATVRLRTGYSGIRVDSRLTAGSLTNLVVLGTALYGITSPFSPTYTDVFGQWTTSAYNMSTCTTGCQSTNPLADGSIKYITRIEAGSPLKGTGASGDDYGANVIFRYGADRSRHGDNGFNTLTSLPLWPWPNEARIRREMCTDTGVTRGFCARPSLTDYIWTYLGNSVPTDFAAGSGVPVSSLCDTNRDGRTNTADVDIARDQVLGISACTSADLEPNGVCNVIDMQRVINAALGQTCRTGY